MEISYSLIDGGYFARKGKGECLVRGLGERTFGHERLGIERVAKVRANQNGNFRNLPIASGGGTDTGTSEGTY